MSELSSRPAPPPVPLARHSSSPSEGASPEKATRTSAANGTFLLFAGVAMLVFGTLLFLFGIYFARMGMESARWPQVTGTVAQTRVRVDSSLRTSRYRNNADRQYFPEIVYRYKVGGKEYRSTRFALGETHEKYREREDAVLAAAGYRAGWSISVYYDPADPASAVLEPGARTGTWAPLGIAVPFIALGMILLGVSRKNPGLKGHEREAAVKH